MARILVVSDESADARELTARLDRLGHAAFPEADAQGARPDLAVVDLASGGGVEAALRMRSRHDAPVVCLVGDVDEPGLSRARVTEPFGYVVKPVDDRQLRLSIDAALSLAQARRREREEARRRTADLESRLALMSTALDGIAEGVIATDAEGRILLVNRALRERVPGAFPEDLSLADRSWELFRADRRTPLPIDESPLPMALKGEYVENVEIFVRRRGESAGVCLSVTTLPVTSPGDGRPWASMALLDNITLRRQAETELRCALEGAQRQAELMKTLVDSISDGVVAANERGEFTLFNPAAERIVGMGMVEGGPSEWSSRYGLYHADGTTPFPPDQLPLARALRGESSDRVEMIVRNANIPDGACLSVNGRPLKDRDGRVAGGVLVFRDVTQVKEAQRQLLETNQRLRQHGRFMETVFDALSDGVVVADASGRITVGNRTARRMTGFPGGAAGDVEPREWSTRFGTYFPDRVTPFPAEDLPLARAIRGESTDGVELFIRNPVEPDGVYISASGRPMRDASGALSGGVVVFSDVTRRMQAQEALTQAFAQGRLEVIDTVLHNIGNAISSVAVGMDTIRREAEDNGLLGRFVALADAVSKHEDDWVVWLRDDPQGRQVRGFLLALVEDLAGQNDRVMRTVSRGVRPRAVHRRHHTHAGLQRHRGAQGRRAAAGLHGCSPDPRRVASAPGNRRHRRLLARAARDPRPGEQVQPDAGQPAQERDGGHRRATSPGRGRRGPAVHSHRGPLERRRPRHRDRGQRHRHRPRRYGEGLPGRLLVEGTRERARAALGRELRDRVRRTHRGPERRPRPRRDVAGDPSGGHESPEPRARSTS